MNDKRKNAYRYLLYCFLIDIRTVPIPSQPKRTNEQLTHYSYYAGSVAYHLHNFALAAATDFIGFDEDSFWSGLEGFMCMNPSLSLAHYRKIFDQQLLKADG